MNTRLWGILLLNTACANTMMKSRQNDLAAEEDFENETVDSTSEEDVEGRK